VGLAQQRGVCAESLAHPHRIDHQLVNASIPELVRQHGWSAVNVYDADPPFLYTVGLIPSFNHPELILFGLESQQAHSILSALVRRIRSGEFFRVSGILSGVLPEGRVIGVRPVHATQHSLYLGRAMAFCMYVGMMDEIEAMQIYWPDKSGKFPFEGGCDFNVFHCQPRLDIPLARSELNEVEPRRE
jgi:hypothetical protein